MGFTRNLEVFEIAGQVREMRLLDPPIDVTNIVFMGMGEPLMNWKAVDPTLTHPQRSRRARDRRAAHHGLHRRRAARHRRARRAAGAVPSRDLDSRADRRAARELMPINTKYPLRDVIEAAKVFDRRVTFEYVMLGGVNDRREHARQLAALARECRAFVNLIPLHPGGAQGFTPDAGRTRSRAFARRAARRSGVEVAMRKSRGMDIAAACGQLRVERLRPAGATSRR